MPLHYGTLILLLLLLMPPLMLLFCRFDAIVDIEPLLLIAMLTPLLAADAYARRLRHAIAIMPPRCCFTY